MIAEQADSEAEVYIENEHPRSVTRNVDHRFVMAGLPGNLPQLFEKLARRGRIHIIL